MGSEKKVDNHDKEVGINNNRVVLFFIVAGFFMSEIILGLYMQNELVVAREDFVSKDDLPGLFVSLLGEEKIRRAIVNINRELEQNILNRRKRGALAVDDNLVTPQNHKEGPNVEFFNPKLRHELEAKDDVERARTGNKGAAPGGDAWVWLTSYSRIPVRQKKIFLKKSFVPHFFVMLIIIKN